MEPEEPDVSPKECDDEWEESFQEPQLPEVPQEEQWKGHAQTTVVRITANTIGQTIKAFCLFSDRLAYQRDILDGGCCAFARGCSASPRPFGLRFGWESGIFDR